MLLQNRDIGGFWDETLFPMIEDLVKYGADALSEATWLDDVLDTLVDAAAATLGSINPALLPAIMAAA